MMKRTRRSAERWRALVAQQRTSGLGVKAFCQREGLAASTFFAWRRRLARPGLPAGGFVELMVQDAGGAGLPPGSARPLAGPSPRSGRGEDGGDDSGPAAADRPAREPAIGCEDGGPAIELLLPGGVRVGVRRGFDASTLRQVVEVLS